MSDEASLFTQTDGLRNSGRPERWLVISHEATNSGAPRMLLEILRGVQAARGPGWSCEILLRRGGALADDFAQLGQVYRLSHRWADPSSLRARFYRAVVDRPWMQPRRLAEFIEQWSGRQFDLVYNNTATNGFVVPAVRRLGCPVLTHVHELEYSLRRFNTAHSLKQTLENSDHFLAVSPEAALDLRACGVSTERITLAPNFLPALPPEPGHKARQAAREKLGLSRDAWVVTGCGHIDRLKGTDLFAETAAILARTTHRRILFNWIGGETDVRFARKVRQLVRRRGLEENFRFVGAVETPSDWFVASDVVAVTSRVESFSLVALEAAALGRTVVGFSGARGLSSVLGDEHNLLVGEFDPAALAEVVSKLLKNSAESSVIGQRLRTKVSSEFLAGPRIAALLGVVDKLQRNRTT